MYQIYTKLFKYTQSKIYIPSTFKIYQNFQIWNIYIPVGNTEVNEDEHSLFMSLLIGYCYV